MGEYGRRPGDKAYRRVHLYVPGVPEFEAFSMDSERIGYSDDEVLEVLSDSGTTAIYTSVEQPITIYYNFPESGVLKINRDNPRICSRLWLQRKGSAVMYKLPNDLPVGNDRKIYARVGGTVGDLVLTGDQYFNKVFLLTQN